MRRFFLHRGRWAIIFCVLFLVSACGDDDDATSAEGADETDSAETDTAEADSSDDSTEPSTSSDDDEADSDEGDSDETDSGDSDSGDAPSASAASGLVTVDGVTYDFTDVTECEVGGDTWGPEWRSFIAFDQSGRNHVNITHAAAPDDWMTSFDLNVGLQNVRTLDQGNPDQQWTTGMGGSVAATLNETGAVGTAEVTNLDVDEGAVDATASWSFSC